MRTVEASVLLLLCLGCSEEPDASKSNSKPDRGLAGEAGAAGSESAIDGAGGSSEAGENGGASGANDAGNAGEAGSGDGLLPDEPDNGTLSGSRLKAEWYDFDGTRVFADFYDTVLEAPCKPGPWSDGKVYCIPVSSATLGFTTKDCTEMLGHVSFNPACERPLPGYLVVPTEPSPCGTASAHVYRLAGTATALTQYYATQNGGCSGPFSTGYNSDTFVVTGEVMAAELVEFTREAPADPGRLSRQYIVSADGARLAIAPRDRDLGTDCSLKVAIADHGRGSCPPTDTKDIAYYRDMDCKDALVSASNACGKPGFARKLDDRSCAQGAASYYQVGEPTDPAALWVGGATLCRSSSVSSGTGLYALGDAVTVPELARGPDNAAGRDLQLIYFSDGKKRYLDQNLYDVNNDTECQINVLPDGTIVCVPFGSSASAFYGDESCTGFVEVGLVYFGAEHCNAPPPLPPFIINPGGAANGCGANYEIRERGPLYTGTPYLMGSVCEPYTGLEPFHLFELGAVRPFSDFPTATLVRDP